MKTYIACCGLDCEKCDVRIATITNDEALREKTAKLWSELNHTEIPPEALYCTGCRTEGVKCVYCEDLCLIRSCAMEKGYATCGACREMETCDKLAPMLGGVPDARENLKLI